MNKKYDRDFFDWHASPRPGRLGPRLLQYTPDAGDGTPGLQWMFRKMLEVLSEYFVIEGCEYSESDSGKVTAGWIFFESKIVEVSEQTSVGVLSSLGDGYFIYINENGVAGNSNVDGTFTSNVISSMRENSTTIDVRFKGHANKFVISHDLIIGKTLDVHGVVDFHSNVGMNSAKITDLAAPTLDNDAVRKTYVHTNFYTKTLLDGGQLDNRYFTETELGGTVINLATHDHVGGDGGQIDHGGLGGKGDDDHTQYHNNIRGDARYYTKTLLDGGQLNNLYYTETELNNGQLDNRYFTETEADTRFVQHSEVDDTPVNGVTTDPISSNWAFDHKADISAHHIKYTNAEALAASYIGIPSDTQKHSHDAEKCVNITAGGAMEKLKEITFYYTVKAKITWEHKKVSGTYIETYITLNDGAYPGYGPHESYSTTYSTVTQNNILIKRGDKLQLWGRNGGGGGDMCVRNFRVKFTDGVVNTY